MPQDGGLAASADPSLTLSPQRIGSAGRKPTLTNVPVGQAGSYLPITCWLYYQQLYYQLYYQQLYYQLYYQQLYYQAISCRLY
jgi:hypothetical protein